ncbi:MAG: PAS domain S-box protein [Desulfovibrionaceae bacterium]|nr:PAS domain S-box protein [Desulfovibrionaceae bacterium]
MDDRDRLRVLEEQVVYLREEKGKALNALEMSSCLSRFGSGFKDIENQVPILEEAAARMRGLVGFKAVCFFLVREEDADFQVALCEPGSFSDYFQVEAGPLIEDRTFAWALARTKPVVVSSRDGADRIMLHSLATESRVRGMFMGVLGQREEEIYDTTQLLITAVLLACAHTLESYELYSALRSSNQDLLRQISIRGRELSSSKELLKEEKKGRRQAEESLQQSEERLRNLYQEAPLGIFQALEDGSLLDLNLEMAHMHGYSDAAEMIGAAPDIFGRVFDDPEKCRELVAEVKAKGETRSFEMPSRRKDGARLWTAVSMRLVRRASGQKAGFEGFVQDLTERKRLEDSLRAAKEQAESASRAKSEFLANVSHEIRTPLNGVLGMLQLAKPMAADPELREYLEIAASSGDSLLAVINDILDFSIIEAGRLRICDKAFKIRELLKTVRTAFGTQVEAKGISLGIEVSDQVPEVLVGDGGRLRQVLFNLVGNAVKFTDAGGVRIEVSLVPQADAAVKRIMFRVSDTGIGIPGDKLEYVFEPFTQIDGSYTRRHPGTGLGLGIVKRLVALMGGAVSIVSREGRGTDVFFSLDFPGTGRAGRLTLRTEAESGLRLIVADRDPEYAESLSEGLAAMGHLTVTASSAKGLLDVLARERFDCLIVDVGMPGLELVDLSGIARRAGSPYEEMSVIVAMSGPEQGGRALAHADAVVSRPVDPAEIEQALDSALGRGPG